MLSYTLTSEKVDIICMMMLLMFAFYSLYLWRGVAQW